jgi:hypothetical protein
VRVRRRGGWSWGDPGEYASRVLAAIEAALTGVAVDAGVQDGTECHLVEPVTLHITPDGRATVESRRALIEQVRAAAAPVAASPAPVTNGSPSVERSERTALVRTAVSDVGWDSLAVTLGRWSRSGRMLAILRSLPSTVVRTWADALVKASRDASNRGSAASVDAIDAIASAILPASHLDTRGEDEPVRVLLVAAAIIAAAGDRLLDARTMDLIMRRVSHDGPVARGTSAPSTRETNEEMLLSAAPATAFEREVIAVASAGPAVVPALPFLALIQLARLGIAQPAAAALAAARVVLPAQVVAAAVAGKTLEPPARGWQRGEPELAAIRFASGLDQDEIDCGLRALAATSDIVEPAWRATLVDLYFEGRHTDADACVTPWGEDRICGEEVGLLPIAWVRGDEELQDVLVQLGDPLVRRSDVLGPLVRLLGPRRGIPGLGAPALERQLGALVGTAVGSLALELWGEDADVPLAFERLHDLEARVVVGDRVSIGVPRGQRWLDLRRAGLLDAWPVPWAPGGIWELGTW